MTVEGPRRSPLPRSIVLAWMAGFAAHTGQLDLCGRLLFELVTEVQFARRRGGVIA